MSLFLTLTCGKHDEQYQCSHCGRCYACDHKRLADYQGWQCHDGTIRRGLDKPRTHSGGRMQQIVLLLISSLLLGCVSTKTCQKRIQEAETRARTQMQAELLFPDTAHTKKVHTLQAEIQRLQKENEELQKYDARVVCGSYCSHRGRPYKKLPDCK